MCILLIDVLVYFVAILRFLWIVKLDVDIDPPMSLKVNIKASVTCKQDLFWYEIKIWVAGKESRNLNIILNNGKSIFFVFLFIEVLDLSWQSAYPPQSSSSLWSLLSSQLAGLACGHCNRTIVTLSYVTTLWLIQNT